MEHLWARSWYVLCTDESGLGCHGLRVSLWADALQESWGSSNVLQHHDYPLIALSSQ